MFWLETVYVSGFAADEQGTALPPTYAPWRPVRSMCFASEQDPIVSSVRTSGYYVVGEPEVVGIAAVT